AEAGASPKGKTHRPKFWEAQRPAQSEVKFGFVAKVRGISANTLGSCATQLPNGKRTPAGSPLLPESLWFCRRPRKPESRWRLSQYLILTRGPRAFFDLAAVFGSACRPRDHIRCAKNP